MTHWLAIGQWPVRRWLIAALVAVGTILVIAIPTDLINTSLFGREIPPTWWARPAVFVSAALIGLLVATYVAPLAGDASASRTRSQRGGYIGGFLTFFAVGCPVCNKLVLLALGTSGAIAWFEPLQPILQLVAIGALLWALNTRLSGERSCRLDRQAERVNGA